MLRLGLRGCDCRRLHAGSAEPFLPRGQGASRLNTMPLPSSGGSTNAAFAASSRRSAKRKTAATMSLRETVLPAAVNSMSPTGYSHWRPTGCTTGIPFTGANVPGMNAAARGKARWLPSIPSSRHRRSVSRFRQNTTSGDSDPAPTRHDRTRRRPAWGLPTSHEGGT